MDMYVFPFKADGEILINRNTQSCVSHNLTLLYIVVHLDDFSHQ